jgi:soluble lytic murein transglycosylase-like protein
MFRRPIIGAIVALLAWLIAAAPASAQIASQVDEDGKVVFVNSETAKSAARKSGSKGFQTNPSTDSMRNNETIMSVVPPDRLDHIVQDAAARHKLDPALVKAVIGVESNWNPSAVSRKGALGLMQLIPSTAGQLGVGNAFDPAQNVEGGTSYLRSLLDRFHGDLEKSLAAYNAGPGLVERVGGVPNIPETRTYVQRVTNSYFRPESGRDPSFNFAPRHPMRREVDERGRVVFTNE